jgi:hypothetical protein
MSYIIVLFYRYAKHISISHIVRANHGDECKLPPTMRTPPICGKSFSFGEERIGPKCCTTSYIHIASRSEPWKAKRNFKKIDYNSKSYLENPTNFTVTGSWFVRPISELWVSILFRKLMDFPTTVIFIVSLHLVSIRPESRH